MDTLDGSPRAAGSDTRPWGARIRAFRLERAWKQAVLAELLGVSQETVSRWETGKVVPSPAVQKRLRALLEPAPAAPANPLANAATATFTIPLAAMRIASRLSRTPKLLFQDDGVLLDCSDGFLAAVGASRESVTRTFADPPVRRRWQTLFRGLRTDAPDVPANLHLDLRFAGPAPLPPLVQIIGFDRPPDGQAYLVEWAEGDKVAGTDRFQIDAGPLA